MTSTAKDIKPNYIYGKALFGVDELNADEIKLVNFFIKFIKAPKGGSCVFHKDDQGKVSRVVTSPVIKLAQIEYANF